MQSRYRGRAAGHRRVGGRVRGGTLASSAPFWILRQVSTPISRRNLGITGLVSPVCGTRSTRSWAISAGLIRRPSRPSAGPSVASGPPARTCGRTRGRPPGWFRNRWGPGGRAAGPDPTQSPSLPRGQPRGGLPGPAERAGGQERRGRRPRHGPGRTRVVEHPQPPHDPDPGTAGALPGSDPGPPRAAGPPRRGRRSPRDPPLRCLSRLSAPRRPRLPIISPGTRARRHLRGPAPAPAPWRRSHSEFENRRNEPSQPPGIGTVSRRSRPHASTLGPGPLQMRRPDFSKEPR
jgi:hypothetical protein